MGAQKDGIRWSGGRHDRKAMARRARRRSAAARRPRLRGGGEPTAAPEGAPGKATPGKARLEFILFEYDGHGGVDGVDGALQAVLSPDGAHLYVARREDDGIAVCRRRGEPPISNESQSQPAGGHARISLGACDSVPSAATAPSARQGYGTLGKIVTSR